MSEGVKLLRSTGMKSNSAKSVMRVLLLGALGFPVEAMETSSTVNGCGIFSLATIGIYITVMCLVAGFSFFLGTQHDMMKGEYQRIMVNKNLKMVLKLLKRAKTACTGRQSESDDESEDVPSETSCDKGVRYMNAEMCEVSDTEVWMEYHHGTADESPHTPEEERSPEERRFLETMRSTNELLTTREHRLQSDLNEAELRNDLDAMERIELLSSETRGHAIKAIMQSKLESCNDTPWFRTPTSDVTVRIFETLRCEIKSTLCFVA